MFKISTNSPFLSFIMKSLSLSVNLVNKADRLYQRFLKITVLGGCDYLYLNHTLFELV